MSNKLATPLWPFSSYGKEQRVGFPFSEVLLVTLADSPSHHQALYYYYVNKYVVLKEC